MQEPGVPRQYEEELEIDIFELIETLLRGKWIIIAMTLAAVIVAAVATSRMPPTYESEMVLSIPEVDDGYGFNLHEYRRFFESPALMEAIVEAMGLDLTPAQLAGRYELDLDTGSRLLTVRSEGETPGEAHSLNEGGYEVFNERVIDFLTSRLDVRIASAEANLEEKHAHYRSARDALNAFEEEHHLSGLLEQRKQMERRISRAEDDLERLDVMVSVDENRLAILEESLGEEPRILGSGGESGSGLPDLEIRTFDGQTVLLNPVYLQLNQDRMETRVRLMGNLERLDILSRRLEVLWEDVEQLRKVLIALEDQESALAREVELAEEMYEEARRNVNGLVESRATLVQDSKTELIATPTRPRSPSAPNMKLNLAIAGFLGLMVSIFAVFFGSAWSARKEKDAAQED